MKLLWPRFGQVFPLELVLSLAVVLVVWTVLLWSVAPALFKARSTEAWMMFSTARIEVVERLAYGIEAPKGPLDERRELSRHVSSQKIVGDTVVLTGDVLGKRYEIAFYPALGSEGAVALWVCGRGSVPEGFTARTPAASADLPDPLLGSACRERRT